jgi:hypothetical protein
MKARKIELELEMGTSTTDVRHLTSMQLRHINADLEHAYNPAVLLDMIKQTIIYDENKIRRRH